MATVATLSPFITTSTKKDLPLLGIGNYKIIDGKMALTSNEGRTVHCWMTAPAKFPTNVNGLYLYVIQDLFLNMAEEIEIIGVKKEYKLFKATIFKQFTEASPEYLAEIIKTRQLAAIQFEAGMIKEVWVYADWIGKMNENNAGDEMVIDSGQAKYLHVKDECDLVTMDERSYANMLHYFSLKA